MCTVFQPLKVLNLRQVSLQHALSALAIDEPTEALSEQYGPEYIPLYFVYETLGTTAYFMAIMIIAVLAIYLYISISL